MWLLLLHRPFVTFSLYASTILNKGIVWDDMGVGQGLSGGMTWSFQTFVPTAYYCFMK
jgi:hypothetical protein